jgi:hypothetical protein
MRYRLRTLVIVLALGPPILGWMTAKGIQFHSAWPRMKSGNGPRIVQSVPPRRFLGLETKPAMIPTPSIWDRYCLCGASTVARGTGKFRGVRR